MYVNSVNTSHLISNAYNNIQKSMFKMATMDRIPAAQYDPAGLAISERLKAQNIEQNMRANNLAMEMNRDATAEAALGSIQNQVQRINELSVQGANGTLTAQDREIIQGEINALKQNITSIAEDTQFNNKQVIAGYTSEGLGLDSLSVIGDAGGAISKSQDVIDNLSKARANLGSSMNAAEQNISNLQSQNVQTLNSYNTLRGLDMAKEMTEMTRNQMLLQAGISMLKTQNEMTGSLLNMFG